MHVAGSPAGGSLAGSLAGWLETRTKQVFDWGGVGWRAQPEEGMRDEMGCRWESLWKSGLSGSVCTHGGCTMVRYGRSRYRLKTESAVSAKTAVLAGSPRRPSPSRQYRVVVMFNHSIVSGAARRRLQVAWVVGSWMGSRMGSRMTVVLEEE